MLAHCITFIGMVVYWSMDGAPPWSILFPMPYYKKYVVNPTYRIFAQLANLILYVLMAYFYDVAHRQAFYYSQQFPKVCIF